MSSPHSHSFIDQSEVPNHDVIHPKALLLDSRCRCCHYHASALLVPMNYGGTGYDKLSPKTNAR